MEMNVNGLTESMTQEQKYYLLGTEYRERKKKNAASHGSGVRTSQEIAREYGINHSTVERAEHFAEGIDAVREMYPDVADEILCGKIKVSQKSIVTIGRADYADQRMLIRFLCNGTPVEGARTKEGAKKNLRAMSAVDSAVAGIYSGTNRAEYTVDSLMREISMNADSFINSLKRTLDGNQALCRENKRTVIATLHKHITKEIEKFEEEILTL